MGVLADHGLGMQDGAMEERSREAGDADRRKEERMALGFHLHRALSALTGALAHELLARGVKLNHQQFSIIRAVNRRPGMSQIELAREIGRDVASISRSAATLEKRGLLKREDINGCTKGVHLTDQARSLLPLLEEAIIAASERSCADASDSDMRTCLKVLAMIAGAGEDGRSG